MIKVRIVRDKQSFIKEFSIKGHAGFGQNGSDIVCAAVSAVAYTAVGALQSLAGISNYTEEDGYMKCLVPVDLTLEQRNKAEIILEAMVIGLKQIEYSYRKHVSVLEEEV